MYTKRLLKFVKAHNGLFTTSEIASIWKRNKWDIAASSIILFQEHKLKEKKGRLYAKC